jgi:HPr serine kinase-like protein
MELQITSCDPLLYDIALPLCATYYFLGFPIEISTNSSLVLAAAEESWGMFEKQYSEPPLEIRIGVLPGEGSDLPPRPKCRGQRYLITQIADGDNYAVLDTRQGFAFTWLTQAAVENRAYLRYHFLEGTAWILLESLYLTSVHGACVEFDRCGVLLCGDSGAGKSSLAYACARNGWKFLSDDATCLIRNRPGRIVTGNSFQMRFRESVGTLFPELAEHPSTIRATGEQAIELPTATRPDIATISKSSVDYIVFLNRSDTVPEGLAPFPAARALRWLEQVVCFGEPQVRQAGLENIRRLATAEIFEMRYNSTDSAIRMLESVIRSQNGSKSSLIGVTGVPAHE